MKIILNYWKISQDCQSNAAHTNMKFVVVVFSLLINGSSTKSKLNHDTQASLTTAQLLYYFNTKFNTSSVNLRHTRLVNHLFLCL